MEKEEFLELYNGVNFKERHKPRFLYRNNGISFHDIYFEILCGKQTKLLKLLKTRKKVVNELIKISD